MPRQCALQSDRVSFSYGILVKTSAKARDPSSDNKPLSRLDGRGALWAAVGVRANRGDQGVPLCQYLPLLAGPDGAREKGTGRG